MVVVRVDASRDSQNLLVRITKGIAGHLLMCGIRIARASPEPLGHIGRVEDGGQEEYDVIISPRNLVNLRN